MDCKFCKIVSGELKCYKLYEDENHIAFLDISPIQEGHFMIIPKRHGEYIFDLDETEYTEIMKLARILSKKLKDATKAKKIGLAVEGFGETHLHIHLMPINKAGDLDPCKHKRASDEKLTEVYNHLLPFFK